MFMSERPIMQQMPTKEETERDYQAGYDRVMRFAEYARKRGWCLSDRQLVHEILQRERAAAKLSRGSRDSRPGRAGTGYPLDGFLPQQSKKPSCGRRAWRID